MVFCTQCGTKALEKHRFCAKCGSPITPPTESTEKKLDYTDNNDDVKSVSFEPKILTTTNYTPKPDDNIVDRKTIFDDGMLVLTSKDVVLYTGDERDELKRIPISSIESCSYSSLRHSLVIKRRVDKEYSKTEKDTKKNVAEIKKETFRLPKKFEEKHTAREEFRIWSYAINRRINGLSQIKINTTPYDAIVTINRRIMGTTPLTTDIPLIDDAVLEGKYHVTVMKEGYETASFSIPAEQNPGYILEEFDLYERNEPDSNTDKLVTDMRQHIHDKSVDLSLYDIEREIEGKTEILLLTRDEILVMDKTKEQCLFEIPYGAISESRYEKGLLKNKSIKIIYNERNFKNLSFEFWIYDADGKISSSELKQRSESLVDFLDLKRKDSKTFGLPHSRLRLPNYFVVTESDINNNFSRFEPFEFERLVARLFEKKGYKTTVTREKGDLGVDVLAEAGSDKIAIQVKHWQAPVGGPDIHKTLGSMLSYGANRAMVVTSSDFTSQAYEIQKRRVPIELWNGSRLRDEFRQNLVDAIKEAKNSES